jgi:hypothetical protein
MTRACARTVAITAAPAGKRAITRRKTKDLFRVSRFKFRSQSAWSGNLKLET